MIPTRDVIRLREYEAREEVALGMEAAGALARTGVVDLSASAEGHGWSLRAKHHVGVVRTNDVELWIEPKIPVENLLFLLAFAKDQRGWKKLVTSFDTSRDFVTAIAMGFVHHASQALQQGVLQGYVSRDEPLNELRGRVRASDQVQRRFSLPLPLEVTFDDFTADIPENGILLTALQRIGRMPNLPSEIARLSRHLGGRLEGVSALPHRSSIPDITFTRLNERYRPAIVLGTLILEAEGLTFRSGGTSTTAFLFDMNRVFEDFVSVAMMRLFARTRFNARLQAHDHLDRARSIAIRPDLSWWRERACLGVADIKYKSLATKALPNADIYQLLAYCVAHDLDRGHLIYAAGNESAGRYQVRHLGVSLDIHALDLSLAPDDLLGEIEAVHQQLVTARTHTVELASPVSASH